MESNKINELIKSVEALVYYSQIYTVKGVQPVHMPDHETAWKNAQRWIWDNCKADKMGNYHLKEAQPGPLWVKASTWPQDHNIVHWRRVEDKKPLLVVGRNYQDNIIAQFGRVYTPNELEWLDEQPAAEPLTENARYELRLALRDMIKLVKRIYGDSDIPTEHQKWLDAADGLLQKHSKITDVLRTAEVGREEDARCAVFVPCTEDDIDCCGGYTSLDGRSLCYVKEVLVPLSAFKQQKETP